MAILLSFRCHYYLDIYMWYDTNVYTLLIVDSIALV